MSSCSRRPRVLLLGGGWLKGIPGYSSHRGQHPPALRISPIVKLHLVALPPRRARPVEAGARRRGDELRVAHPEVRRADARRPGFCASSQKRPFGETLCPSSPAPAGQCLPAPQLVRAGLRPTAARGQLHVPQQHARHSFPIAARASTLAAGGGCQRCVSSAVPRRNLIATTACRHWLPAPRARKKATGVQRIACRAQGPMGNAMAIIGT